MKKNKIKIFSTTIFVFIFFQIFVLSFIFFYINNRKQKKQYLSASQTKVLGISTIKIKGEEYKKNSKPNLKKDAFLDFSNISAKAFLVYDVATKKNLAEKNIHEKLPIASLTKLLTGLVVYENLKMDDLVTIEPEDKLSISPYLNLKIGNKLQVYDLFSAMLIGSANDATLTLANFTERNLKQNFIELMNKKAQDLKMTSSSFGNPIGFDSANNFSTVADLKNLIEETQKFSAFVSLGKKLSYTFQSNENHYSIKTTNKLLYKHKEVESIKTGFTLKSAGSLIVKINDSDHSIIVIILGSENREDEVLKLSKTIFTNYYWE